MVWSREWEETYTDALQVVAAWFVKQIKAKDTAGKEDCTAAARMLINYLFKHGYRVLPIKEGK